MKYFFLFLVLIIGCETVPPIKYPDGGYDYPKTIAAKDTGYYYYPLKNIVSRRDSFYDALQDKFYQLFNEPNLSLKPSDKEIFRFVFIGWKIMPIIIILTDEKIIVKKGVNMGYEGPEEDEERLTPIEKIQLYMLRRFFPFDTAGLHPLRIKYIDSMIDLYPQLRDTKYFRYLIDKSTIPKAEMHSSYTTKTINLTKKEFTELINDINASNYWKLPRLIECDHPDTDGDGFSLEANTKEHYNIVFVQGCSNDITKFTKACQKLIGHAHLDKRYNLIWGGTTTQVAQ